MSYVGTTVLNYRLVRLLGEGGFGAVFLAEHEELGRRAACKILHREFAGRPDIVERFAQEARTVAAIGPRGIIEIENFGQLPGGEPFCLMQFFPGEALSARIHREPLRPEELPAVFDTVASALAAAHAKQIVHRDLKPENVLLVRSKDGKDELPKVCDFGVAKLHEAPEGANDATNQNAVVGTPYYMAPEQIRGEDVDQRADIYALGAMMYRLLTGTPPFEAPSPMAVFAKHLTEPPQPPSERAPKLNLPRAIDAIILKAMAKRAEDRHPNATALQQELVDFLRAGNASSVDLLVDQGQLQAFASQFTAISDSQTGMALPRKAATRDEVAAYERKLAFQRILGQAFLGLCCLGAAGALWLGYRQVRSYVEALSRPPPPPEGTEREPNDEAAQANPIPFGKEIRGQLGRRLAPDRSDRDFYAWDVPPGTSHASLKLTALPNFPTCLWLYRGGFREPLARFCSGALLQDLSLPAYRVEPGRYLLAVLQDMDPRGADAPPPVHENISDFYTLSFSPASPSESDEIEPNDSATTAVRVPLGAEIRGSLNFANDTDVLCPSAGLAGSSLRWTVRDSVSLVRPTGTALEASLDRGGIGGSTRYVVHRAGSQGKVDAGNVLSPFVSPVVKLDGATTTGCLSLRLVRDSWTSTTKDPLPSDEPYSVKLESAP